MKVRTFCGFNNNNNNIVKYHIIIVFNNLDLYRRYRRHIMSRVGQKAALGIVTVSLFIVVAFWNSLLLLDSTALAGKTQNPKYSEKDVAYCSVGFLSALRDEMLQHNLVENFLNPLNATLFMHIDTSTQSYKDLLPFMPFNSEDHRKLLDYLKPAGYLDESVASPNVAEFACNDTTPENFKEVGLWVHSVVALHPFFARFRHCLKMIEKFEDQHSVRFRWISFGRTSVFFPQMVNSNITASLDSNFIHGTAHVSTDGKLNSIIDLMFVPRHAVKAFVNFEAWKSRLCGKLNTSICTYEIYPECLLSLHYQEVMQGELNRSFKPLNTIPVFLWRRCGLWVQCKFLAGEICPTGRADNFCNAVRWYYSETGYSCEHLNSIDAQVCALGFTG